MQNLVESIASYVRETRRLESLPSSTETTFYPDLKLFLSAVLKNERLLFDVITGTSEAGPRRHDMPDFVLGDSSLFVGVYGEVKRANSGNTTCSRRASSGAGAGSGQFQAKITRRRPQRAPPARRDGPAR
jgi:hypothetical protein